MKKILYIILILLFWTGTSFAVLGDCQYATVAAAVAGASTGDTVELPTCTETWNTMLTIPSSTLINLKGQGSTSTVITIGNAVSTGLMVLTPDSEGTALSTRITGIGFVSETGATTGWMIQIGGANWRIDNCKFTNNTGRVLNSISANATYISTPPKGLIDNNEFINGRIGGGSMPSYYTVFYRSNAIWADDTIGDRNAVYVEDNTFTQPGSYANSAIDSNYAGRYVLRYNSISDVGIMAHSLQARNSRGTRRWEVYGNTFVETSGGWTPAFQRGGTGIYFDNEITGTWSDKRISIDNVRSCGTPTTDNVSADGTCDGDNIIDGNSDATGWPCRDQIGRTNDASLWNTATISSCADNGSGKVRITTTAAHAILDTETAYIVPSGTLTGCGTGFSLGTFDITAVTSTTIDLDLTYTSPKVGGASIHGDPPAQASFPLYVFNNTDGATTHYGVHVHDDTCAEITDHLKENRDFYVYDAAFDGSTGVGRGNAAAFAAFAADCTAGVGYWVTDEGEWDATNGATADGRLYTCNAGGNAWTLAYTPYTYPHPLTGGTAVPSGTCVVPGGLVEGAGLIGKIIYLDLTDDTWVVAAGSVFDNARQAVINGLDSDKAEANGWNAEIRDKEIVTAVVRTSDTRVTITLTTGAAHDITASETITVTIPTTAVASATEIVATPSFVISVDTSPPVQTMTGVYDATGHIGTYDSTGHTVTP